MKQDTTNEYSTKQEEHKIPTTQIHSQISIFYPRTLLEDNQQF